MEIKEGKNRFYIGEENHFSAEITFMPSNADTIVIDHTFVDPSLRGQGIAKQLVERVVQYARDNQKKIIPTCSYARVVMDRDTSMDDVRVH